MVSQCARSTWAASPGGESSLRQAAGASWRPQRPHEAADHRQRASFVAACLQLLEHTPDAQSGAALEELKHGVLSRPCAGSSKWRPSSGVGNAARLGDQALTQPRNQRDDVRCASPSPGIIGFRFDLPRLAHVSQ
jgi:hypothetical protein